MKAWHISKGKTELIESQNEREANEIKVKVAKVAVSPENLIRCAKGLSEVAIPGHSAVARVSEANADTGLRLGTRVIIDPFVTSIERGQRTVHTRGIDMDGLLCDFISIPEEDIYVLPDGIKDESAVFVDYIALGIKALQELELEKGNYVVIVGGTTLGLIMCQLAQYYQYVPILIDMDQDKLNIAKKWEVCYTLNPTFDDIGKEVMTVTGGRYCDAAVVTSDTIDFNAAFRLIKDSGIVGVAGYSTFSHFKLDPDIVLKRQLRAKGICNGDGEISTAINMLANNFLDLESLSKKSIYFEDVPKAVEECIKYPLLDNEILVEI